MHLRGNSYAAKDVIGVYPLFSDGTCRFLVFDFDNHEKNAEKKDFANTDDTWIEEVEAMRDICTLNGGVSRPNSSTLIVRLFFCSLIV